MTSHIAHSNDEDRESTHMLHVHNLSLTLKFTTEVVLFTNELVLVQNVQFLTSRQLLATHHTGETLEMKYFVPRPPHQVVGRDTLRAPGALCAVTPATHGQGTRMVVRQLVTSTTQTITIHTNGHTMSVSSTTQKQ